MFRLFTTKRYREIQETLSKAASAVEFAEKRADAAEKALAVLNASQQTVYCSFCGESQHEVKMLIAGPSSFICDECVEGCLKIIINRNIEARAAKCE